MGGEKNLPSMVCEMVRGSPPRGRGKGMRARCKPWSGRITPAWAGKSSLGISRAAAIWDHPRVGGEKCHGYSVLCHSRGSPPRGRGKVIDEMSQKLEGRITPAWAGKSEKRQGSPSGYEDHPRVGGEKSVFASFDTASLGSPPRGRGKGKQDLSGVHVERITPAWAGKRLKRSHRSGIFISRPIPFHSVLHRPAGSGSSRAGRDGSPAGQPQNAGPA